MSTLQTAVNNIITKNIGGNPEKKVLIYDTRCGLSNLLADAYRVALGPDAICYDFDRLELDSLNFRDILIGLPA